MTAASKKLAYQLATLIEAWRPVTPADLLQWSQILLRDGFNRAPGDSIAPNLNARRQESGHCADDLPDAQSLTACLRL